MRIEDIKLPWPEWDIEEQLGKGGFGAVYRVCKTQYGHTSYAAVKIIKIPADDTELQNLETNEISARFFYGEIIEGFLKELALMESLKGVSNIVSIDDYEAIEYEDSIGCTLYIKMELLTNLNQYRKEHTMDLDEIIKLGVDICTALAICKREGIVHRDIKPSNILVSKFGDFKLGDFGVSRNLEHTMSGISRKGTGIYMAPELYLGKGYNSTVDIYSLGLVLYRLLNKNTLPFEPVKLEERTHRAIQTAFERRIKGGIFPDPITGDKELGDILRKACHIDPKRRHQTAEEFRQALLDYGKGNYESRSVEEEFSEEETERESIDLEVSEETVRENGTVNGDKKVLNISVNHETEDPKKNNGNNTDGGKKKKGIRIAAGVAGVLIAAIGAAGFLLSRNNYEEYSNSAESGDLSVGVVLMQAYDDEIYNEYWKVFAEKCKDENYHVEIRWLESLDDMEDQKEMLKKMADRDYDVVMVECSEKLKEQNIADIITEMQENGMNVVVFEESEDWTVNEKELEEFIIELAVTEGLTAPSPTPGPSPRILIPKQKPVQEISHEFPAKNSKGTILVILPQVYNASSYNGYWIEFMEECRTRGYSLEFKRAVPQGSKEHMCRLLRKYAESDYDAVVIDYMEPYMEQDSYEELITDMRKSGKVVWVFDKREVEEAALVEGIRTSIYTDDWFDDPEDMAERLDDLEEYGLGRYKAPYTEEWLAVYETLRDMEQKKLDAFAGMDKESFYAELGITEEMLHQVSVNNNFMKGVIGLSIEIYEGKTEYINLFPENANLMNTWVIIEMKNGSVSEIGRVGVKPDGEFRWKNFSVAYN